MHLAFFNRSFHPDTGATGQLLTELCESLVETHGCRVSVVAGVPLLPASDSLARGLWMLRREHYRGIEILRAQGTRFSNRRFAGRFTNYVSYFLLASYAGLRLDRPDVVVAQTDPPIIGLAAHLAARRFGAPLVMVYEDIFPEVARLLEDFRSEWMNRWLDRVNRSLLRQATAVVAIGETMAQRLVELKGADPRKVTVIHNWADRSVLGPEPKCNPVAEGLGLADRFVVLHSGNLGLSQGLEGVLDAANFLQDLPNVLLVFQGDGVKRAALVARARKLRLDNVRFLPYARREHLRYVFGAADVQVVSLRRGLAGFIVPSKLYGILASGKPYVAAVEEDSEVAHLTDRYGSGLVVPPEAPETLAKGIRRLYEDPALRKRLGANGLAASAFHDRPVAVAAYHRLLTAAAAGGQLPMRVIDDVPELQPRISAERMDRGVAAGGKRAFDVGLAAVGLASSLPLWGLIALAIKWEDGGPVFFRDERVGRGGRLFEAFKFRSMVSHTDWRLEPRQAAPDDTRVTRVGQWLRATAMDELPQLWNIVRGDMSFVGPRALRPGEIHARGNGEVVRLEHVPGYQERHAVRPGLTGLAQIYADRDVLPPQKFRYDRLYLRRRSLGLDLRLIALSFCITLRGRWECRGRKL